MARITASDVCRVGVQFESGRMDFVLPAELSVAAMIPSIVDHVAARSEAHNRRGWQEVPADWQLSHIDGRPLISRASLRDNAIRDGDVLWLSRVRPATASPPADDPIARLSASLDAAPRWTPTATRVAISTATLCCAALAAYALLRSTSSAAPMTAGLLAALALGAAVAVRRGYGETPTAVALGAGAAASSAVGAYLLVPGGATAPKLMLAGAASATVSVFAVRCIGCGTAVFSGLSSFGVLSAAAACVPVVALVRVAATGAVLATAAVALLILAPRFAIWAGRVPVPRLPAPGVREVAVAEFHPGRAHRAHAIVTGLVCGSTAAATLGAFVVARAGGNGGAAFAMAVGLTLTLRAATHVDLVQVAALLISGATCFAAVFVCAVGTWQQYAHWVALVAVGAAAVSTACSAGATTASPLTRRCVELVEYAALASLIPLACWVCGAFAAARGWHLS